MIYFVLLVIWVMFADVICKKAAVSNRKKLYCWLVFIPAALLMGLRSRYVGGVDTNWYYIPTFKKVCNYSWDEIFTLFEGKDIGFYIVEKLFTYISDDPYAFIFVVSLFIVGSYTLFVYRYSAQPVISFFVYFALGYYTAGFQLIRHMLSISILLFAYPYILNKKPIKFILIVLLASTFHSSALVFLLAYPLAFARIGWKQWLIVVATVVVSYAFGSRVFTMLEGLLGDSDRYGKFTTGDYGTEMSIVGFLIILCVYVASYITIGKRKRRLPESRVLFNLSAISLSFMSMVILLGEFWRISMFFGMYNTLLLPTALTEHYRSAKNKNVAATLIFLICTMLIIYFIVFRLENDMLSSYEFFWDDVYI